MALAAALVVALPATAMASTNVTPRIVGGTATANPGWMAYLNISFADGDALCGGELITKHWLLTAAHCVTQDGTTDVVDPSAVTAWIGLDHLADATTTPGATVNEILVDPAYDPTTLNGDVAVMYLSLPSDREPAVLGGPGDPAVGSVPTVLGWGVVDSVTQMISDNLLRTSAPILDPSRCSGYGTSFVAASMICAGGATGQDSCSGDSGGPLVANAANQLATLVGTVDYGSATCGDGQPSVYQRLTSGPVETYLENLIPMERITRTGGLPIAGEQVTFTATDGNMLNAEPHTWDLDADGQFDDATGDAVTIRLSTSLRSIAVRAVGAFSDVAMQRITVVPSLGKVAVTAPLKQVSEGSVMTLWMRRALGGLGTVRATLAGAAPAPVAVSVPADQMRLDLRVPDDDATWQPSRNATLSITADGLQLTSPSTYAVRVIDNDRPKLRLSGVRRRGAREIVIPVTAPGPGVIRLTAMAVGNDHILLRKRVSVAGTSRKVVLRFGRSSQRRLSKAGPRIKVTWLSSVDPTGYVVRTIRGPRLRRP
ncbi:MAG: hypothetical protein QOI98_597 [Solirubrobacteraceae bacterium]|nr:hypothetical protein [Solirubrobacteraceae bacterium]